MRPAKWIQTVSGLSYAEILKESNNAVIEIDVKEREANKPVVVSEDQILPLDAINLCDEQQLEFYRQNKVVQEALALITRRKLDVAVNRPKTFWVSLVDKIHKNRLVIPFYDLDNKIAHYQTRTIIENKKYKFPKYLSKSNSEKTLFGISQVQDNTKFLFITEGPLDACFIKNGIAVAGITEGKGAIFTSKQQQQLGQFPMHEHVWVLDNQYTDKASYSKSQHLTKQGCKVFIWPKELKKYKDLNELCIAQNITHVPERFILKHSYAGLKAKLLLTNINLVS